MKTLVVTVGAIVVGCHTDQSTPDAETANDCEPLAALCNSAKESEIAGLLDGPLISECLSVADAGDDSMCRARTDCAVECAPAAPANAENRIVGCWEDRIGTRTVGFGPANIHNYKWSDVGEMFSAQFSVHGDEGKPEVVTLYSFQAQTACYHIRVRSNDMFLSNRRLIATDTCTLEADFTFEPESPATTISASRWDLTSTVPCE